MLYFHAYEVKLMIILLWHASLMRLPSLPDGPEATARGTYLPLAGELTMQRVLNAPLIALISLFNNIVPKFFDLRLGLGFAIALADLAKRGLGKQDAAS